jgi:predicted Zn finger-like uncharacterized protein
VSIVTSCPSCATTFRVVHEQLRARQGKVRCGKCQEVFDAFKTLASFPDNPQPEPAAPPEAEPTPSNTPAPVQATLDIDPPTRLDPLLATGGASLRTRGVLSRENGRLWLALVAVLGAAFVLQLLYVLRAPLSAAVPGMRPLFERVCAMAGCTVPLPRKTEALAIESSDLQSDPARPGVIVLTASLRNRGSSVVEHPALELTLTNAQDRAVARRVFLPKDYLGRASDAAAGLQPHAEVNVRIELDTSDLKAAGYRLFLFYP